MPTLTNTLVANLKRHNIKDIAAAINIANDLKQWRDIFRVQTAGGCGNVTANQIHMVWNFLMMLK